ncbi:MAG: hypothetical protein U0941_22160 [Planctomycetaceae bacterium]
MQQPSGTSNSKSNHADDSSSQLTEAQRRFAEVIGWELARLWIDEQAAKSPTAQVTALPRSRKKS